MKERRVIGGAFEARLSGGRDGRGHDLGASSETQVLDNLPPFPRSRQNAQPAVSHVATLLGPRLPGVCNPGKIVAAYQPAYVRCCRYAPPQRDRSPWFRAQTLPLLT